MSLQRVIRGSGRALRIARPASNNITRSSLSFQRLTTFTPRATTTNSLHTTAPKMSFSNTDTGSKDADPYTSKNQQEPSLKEKVEDLKTFVDRNKFCLLTTKNTDGLLVARAMALAAKVRCSSSLRVLATAAMICSHLALEEQ